jgi:hypothetical protein
MAKFRNLKKEIRELKKQKSISRVMVVILKEGEESPQFNGLLITLRPAKKRELPRSEPLHSERVQMIEAATAHQNSHAEVTRNASVRVPDDKPKPDTGSEQAKVPPWVEEAMWIPITSWWGSANPFRK